MSGDDLYSPADQFTFGLSGTSTPSSLTRTHHPSSPIWESDVSSSTPASFITRTPFPLPISPSPALQIPEQTDDFISSNPGKRYKIQIEPGGKHAILHQLEGQFATNEEQSANWKHAKSWAEHWGSWNRLYNGLKTHLSLPIDKVVVLECGQSNERDISSYLRRVMVAKIMNNFFRAFNFQVTPTVLYLDTDRADASDYSDLENHNVELVNHLPGSSEGGLKPHCQKIRIEYWRHLQLLKEIDHSTFVISLNFSNPWRRTLGIVLSETTRVKPAGIICYPLWQSADGHAQNDAETTPLSDWITADEYEEVEWLHERGDLIDLDRRKVPSIAPLYIYCRRESVQQPQQ